MTPWVQRLLIANVIVFFVQMTMPTLANQFAFVPAHVLSQPWTMVTYMFLHGGFGHIFWNMIALYFFGPRVEMRLGTERFFALYFISGIAGALLSFALAPNAAIIGASGAIYGVMLAFARFWPRDQIYIWGIIPIEARWLVVGYTLLNVFGGFGGGMSNEAHFAHLGGFAGAFLYLTFLMRDKGAKRFKREVTATRPLVDSTVKNWRQVDRSSVHAVNKDEVDRILDKINASGIASLTPQERLFLSNFVPPDDRKPVN